MSRHAPWLLALAVFVAAAVPAQAAAVRKPAKSKLASSPEEAVKCLAEAFQAGDVQGVLAQLAEPVRTMAQAHLEIMEANRALDAAINKKFGKGQKNPTPDVKEEMMRTRKLLVIGKEPRGEGKVRLTIWETRRNPADKEDRITEKTWTAVKVGKGWKLIIPMSGSISSRDTVTKKGPGGNEVKVHIEKPGKDEEDPKMLEAMKKLLPKYRQALQKCKEDVEAGKYKTREEARAAMRKADEAVRAEFERAAKEKKEEKK